MLRCLKNCFIPLFLIGLIAIYFNTSLKIDLAHYCIRTYQFLYYKMQDIFFHNQIPIYYIKDEEKINNIVKNPPKWMIDQINNDFKDYEEVSINKVNDAFVKLNKNNMLVKVTINPSSGLNC